MKKCVVIFIIALAFVLPFVFAGENGFETADALSSDTYDSVFIDTVDELAPEEGFVNGFTLLAEREVVYDVSLKALGFVYDFSIDGKAGYAMMIVDEVPEITEIYFDAQNPYASIPDIALNVYISNTAYAYFLDGNFYFASDNQFIPSDLIGQIDGVFFGGAFTISETETINYVSKTPSSYNVALITPVIYLANASNFLNGCAPLSGGNIIVYYDRFAPNLIENYEPGSFLGTNYMYKTQNADTEGVARQLYIDMNTNKPTSGTTIAQFKSGISTYCARKGRTSVFTSVMSGGNFDFNAAKSKLDAGQPLAMFMKRYNVVTTSSNSNQDVLEYYIGVSNHTYTGFGYKTVAYTFSDGSTRTDKFIYVSTGLSTIQKGYYNVNYQSDVDDAYAVNIY